MKIKNVTMGILALAMGILRADLFDTVDELDAKYGSPVLVQEKNGRELRTYQSGDYLIEASVQLDDNPDNPERFKCVKERHTRVDGKRLFRSEVDVILKRRQQRGEWQYVGDGTWRLLNIGKAFHYQETGTVVQYSKL